MVCEVLHSTGTMEALGGRLCWAHTLGEQVVTESSAGAWHQALAFAVTGRRYPELGRQQRPDVPRLAEFLRSVSAGWGRGRSYRVPADLSAGLGAAQLAAAAAELRRLLEPHRPVLPPASAARPPTADERRLLREVPPHHGS